MNGVRLRLALTALILATGCENEPACVVGPDGACVDEIGQKASDSPQPAEEPVPLPDGPLVDKAVIEQLRLSTPGGDDVLRVHHPVDVEVRLRVHAEGSVTVPVHVGLVQPSSGDACFLGGLEAVHHGGEAVVTVRKRLYVPSTCLGAASTALDPPVAGLLRQMVPTTTVDPSNAVRQADDPQPAPTTVHSAEKAAAGDPLAVACQVDGEPCGQTLTVVDAAGLDVELSAVDLGSSVVVRQRCIPAPPGSKARCWNQGLSEDRDDADLHVQITLEAFGLPATDLQGNELDVLHGKGLQLAYALRPAGKGGWVPLWVRKRGGQLLNQTSHFQDTLTTREPRFVGQPLSFDNGCKGEGCVPDRTVADLIDTGAWSGETAFELRACLSTSAETAGVTANNCRTRKFLLLRKEALPADPNAASDAYSGPGAVNGIECPSGSSFCWSLKKGWNDAMNFGSEDSFKLAGGLNSFTRADLQQVVSKHDLLAELRGFVHFELFKAYAYAAVYTDPDWFGDDPDKPTDDSCECKVRNKKTFLDADEACEGECDAPPECSKVTDAKKKKACKKKCMQRCKNKCAKDNGKCGPACNDAKNDCIGKCDKKDTACKKKCGLAQKDCNAGCKKKVLGCSKTELEDADECDCQAYYNYGIRVFGSKVWGKEKASRLEYVYKISYSKEYEKEKTFLAGPVPINVGFKVEGELGVEFSISLASVHGEEEPELPENICAAGTEEDYCGGTSKDGSCYCDFACVTYGDCCEDYTAVCEMAEPTLPVIDTEEECKTDLCADTLKSSSYVVTLAGVVKPYATLDAEGWAGLGGALLRAVVKGELNLFDIGIPFTLAGKMGVEGPVTSPKAIHFVAEAFLVLEAAVLAGNVGVSFDAQWIKWCDDFFIPYPCGFDWTTIWSYEFASWDGWEWEVDLWSAPLGSKTIQLQSPETTSDCTTSVCTTAAQ